MKLTAVVPVFGPTYADRRNQIEAILTSAINVRVLIVADSFNAIQKNSIKNSIKEKARGEVELIEGNFGDPGSARNAALDKIETDWFCFWDSDDSPDSEMYLKMIKTAEEAYLPIAKGGYKTLSMLGERSERLIIPKLHIEHRGEHLTEPGLWRYVFKRNVYGKLRFPMVRMGEDQDYLVQALMVTESVHNFPHVIYSYSVGGKDQLTNTAVTIDEVFKSLIYLGNLRMKGKTNRENNEIIITSFLKQFTSLLIRNGFRTLVENPRFISKCLIEAIIRNEFKRPFQILIRARFK